MKKFAIATPAGVRVVNANEYSVSPKLGEFSAIVKGDVSPAWSTAGRGKSAVPNYYLYFREGSTLYYFRSNPAEIAAARESFVVDDEKEIDRLTPAERGDEETVEIEPSAPAPKRTRRAK